MGPAKGQTAPHVPLEHQRAHRRRHVGNPAEHNRHEGPRASEGDLSRLLQHRWGLGVGSCPLSLEGRGLG